MIYKRFSCLFCLLLLVLPVFAITTTDNIEISAYKRGGGDLGNTWVRIQVRNLEGELLGPGRSLDLSDGSDWVNHFYYTDAFAFTMTGNIIQPIFVIFEFSDFEGEDDTRLTGSVRFKEQDFVSDYGSLGYDGWRYYTTTIGGIDYTYREHWPIAYTAGTYPLNGGALAVAGSIMRKRTGQADSTYTNSYPGNSIQQYTRTGIVQLMISSYDYIAASPGTTYISNVTVTCVVE